MKNPNDYLFEYCPGCGRKQLSAPGEKSFLCRVCGFKFYLNTAAAGIALIFNKDNQLLITKRKKNPAGGTFDLPGGFAEPGETIEGCLIREIKEELNLDITGLTYFCSVPNTYLYHEITYCIIDLVFFCTVSDFSTISANDDISHFYFKSLVELDPNLFGLDSVKKVITRVLKK